MDLYAMALRWRERLLKRDAAALADLARAYEGVYRRLRREMDEAVKALTTGGRAPGRRDARRESAAYRVTRLRELERQITEALAAYGVEAGERITQGQTEAVNLAAEGQAEMIAAQAPRVAASLVKFPSPAMEALVGLAGDGTPLAELLAAMAPAYGVAARDRLLQGLALGHGPDKIAAAFRDEMGVPLTRALRVARTEVMRAYREGARLYARENAAGIVDGYWWRSGRDARTCPVCWAMDGTWQPIEEPFATHVNCRCCVIPAVKKAPGAPAPWTPVETGEEAFAALDPTRQREALGPGKYELYRNGEIRLADLVKEGRDERWGAYRVERPLKELASRSKRRTPVETAAGATRGTGPAASGGVAAGGGAPPGGGGAPPVASGGSSDGGEPPRVGARMTYEAALERAVDRHLANPQWGIAPIDPDCGDPSLAAIAEDQGFDGLPHVVGRGEWSAAIARGEKEAVRGVSREVYAREFQAGRYFTALNGRAFGGGVYFACGPGSDELAEEFARLWPGGSPVKMRITIRPGARIGDWERLHREAVSEQRRLRQLEMQSRSQGDLEGARRAEATRLLVSDVGRYAALRGYDIIRVANTGPRGVVAMSYRHYSVPGTHDEIIVLNRTAVRVLRNLEGI